MQNLDSVVTLLRLVTAHKTDCIEKSDKNHTEYPCIWHYFETYCQDESSFSFSDHITSVDHRYLTISIKSNLSI